MELFNNIKNSIYSPKFYQDLLAKPFSFSVRYFVLLALIVSLIGTINFSFTVFPAIKLFVDDLGPKILNYYPNDLQLTINKGQASTNVNEPYFIKVPEEFKDDKGLENVLVIDTKNDFSLENFYSYKSFALLTKDSIISYTDNGININQIDKNVNFYLDKNKITDFYNKIKPFIKFIYPASIPLIFIGYLLSFSFQAIYLLFGALVIWLACVIKNVKIDYKKAYQLGLHLSTAIVLIQLILMIFGVTFYIPFMFTILLFVVALINIKKIQNYEN